MRTTHSPAQGWPLWCLQEIEAADHVLAVCSSLYQRRFESKEEPGIGLGAVWEGHLLRSYLYDSGCRKNLIVLLLLGQ